MDGAIKLRKAFESLYPFSEEDWSEFSLRWKFYECSRKVVITNVGEVERYLYFVVDGVQRVYYQDLHDREATIVFTYSPSFGGVLDSLMLEQPSRYYFETLTPSVFLRIARQDLFEYMDRHPSFSNMIRNGITRTFSGVLERLVELQCFSAEERFKRLLDRSPHILQLVPQKYLANYLGMDPTNFSKLMNKVKI
jgi:CRP-like cAMP-binding protein